MACRFLLPRSRFAENRFVLGNASWQFGLSSLVLEYFFLIGVGLRLDMKWAGVAKFFGPTIMLANHNQNVLSCFRIAQNVFIYKVGIECSTRFTV